MRSNAEGRGHLAEGSSSVAKRCLHAPSFTVFKPARKRESKPAQISTSVHPVRELIVAHQRRAWAEGREESMADAGSSALPSFFCPLTLDLMRDPVSTEDGQTFVDFLGTTFQRYYEHAVGGKAAKGTMFCLIFILTVD